MVHFTGECFFAYEFTESVFTFFSILMCLWGLKALEEKSGALLVLKYVLSAGGAIVLGVYVLLQWDNLYFISQEKTFLGFCNYTWYCCFIAFDRLLAATLTKKAYGGIKKSS